MSLKKQFLRSDVSDLGCEGRSSDSKSTLDQIQTKTTLDQIGTKTTLDQIQTKTTLDQIRRLVESGDVVKLKNVTRVEGAAFHPNHDIRSDLWKVLCDLHRGSRCVKVDGSQFDPLLSELDASQQDDSGFMDKTIIKSTNGSQESCSNSNQKESCSNSHQSGRKLPGFVDLSCCRYFYLNPVGQKIVERILWCIAHDHPEITFSPLLYPIASLFLHYMDPVDVLTLLLILIESNKGISGGNSHPMIPTSKSQMSRDAYVLTKLTNKLGLSLVSMIIPSRRNRLFSLQRSRLACRQEIDHCFHDWLKWIFIGLPFPHLIRVMDCFLVEGFKFFFRIGLSLLLLHSRSAGSHDDSSRSAGSHDDSSRSAGSHDDSNLSLDSMLRFSERIQSSQQLSPQQLVDFATSLSRFSGKRILKQYEKAGKELRVHPTLSSSFTPQSSPCLSRRVDMIRKDVDSVQISSRVAPRGLDSSIIDWFLLDTLWDWLPERIAIQEPVIAFSTNIHGSSLRTFFDKTAEYESSVLLIKTTKGEVFGAYCSASWTGRLTRDTPGSFFGTGESFLFTLKPNTAKYPWVGEGSGQVRGLRSTQLFMSTNGTCLIIGSGAGSGLWLDQQLTRGKSEHCMTFNNRPLSDGIDFECAVIEVIGFRG